MTLTAERLRHVLGYNEETGDFVWLVATSNRVKVGQVAGNSSGHEYHRIRVDGELHYAHRLAVLHATGEWPNKKVDHKSINKRDNSLDEPSRGN